MNKRKNFSLSKQKTKSMLHFYMAW